MPSLSLVFLALRTVVLRRFVLANGLGFTAASVAAIVAMSTDPQMTDRQVIVGSTIFVGGGVLGVLIAYQQGCALLVEDTRARMGALWDTVVQSLAPASFAQGEVLSIDVPGNISHRESVLPTRQGAGATGTPPTSAAWCGNHGLQRWLPSRPVAGAPPVGTHLPRWFLDAFDALRVHQGVDLRPILPYTIEVVVTLGQRSAHQRLQAHPRLLAALGAPSAA